MTDINLRDQIGTPVVTHVLPPKSEIKLAADWMRTAVADTPNNWVQSKTTDGNYPATMG